MFHDYCYKRTQTNYLYYHKGNPLNDLIKLIEFIAGKLKDGENALILLVQEDDDQVLNQYFAKFPVSVMRWDDAEVAVQVEEAKKEEIEMEHIMRQNMRKEKTDEFKDCADTFRKKLKDDFMDLKSKIKK